MMRAGAQKVDGSQGIPHLVSRSGTVDLVGFLEDQPWKKESEFW